MGLFLWYSKPQMAKVVVAVLDACVRPFPSDAGTKKWRNGAAELLPSLKKTTCLGLVAISFLAGVSS